MFSNSLTISAVSFPSFVRRGEGEVEAMTGMPIRMLYGRLVLPHLTSPYKGEGKNTMAPPELSILPTNE